MKKIIIIGAGPAGVSAALYIKRANLDVKILYKSSSSLLKAHQIDNYYGLPGVSGEELYHIGLKQAANLGIELIEEEVLSVEYDNPYAVITKEHRYDADAVLLTTGSSHPAPLIKNLKTFEGKGVSYCAVCDGFFYRNKNIAVLGSETYAAHEAEYLNSLTDHFMVLTNGKDIADPHLNQYPIVERNIVSCYGDDYLRGVTLNNGQNIPLDGLFIAEGSAGAVDLAKKMGILISDNKIEVNENMQTNLPGIYAAGDCVKGLSQVAKAICDGALAATDIIRYIRSLN